MSLLYKTLDNIPQLEVQMVPIRGIFCQSILFL